MVSSCALISMSEMNREGGVIPLLYVLGFMWSCPYEKVTPNISVIVLKTAAFCLTGANTVSLLRRYCQEDGVVS